MIDGHHKTLLSASSVPKLPVVWTTFKGYNQPLLNRPGWVELDRKYNELQKEAVQDSAACQSLAELITLFNKRCKIGLIASVITSLKCFQLHTVVQ